MDVHDLCIALEACWCGVCTRAAVCGIKTMKKADDLLQQQGIANGALKALPLAALELS